MLATQSIGNEEDSPERLLELLGPTDDPNMLVLVYHVLANPKLRAARRAAIEANERAYR